MSDRVRRSRLRLVMLLLIVIPLGLALRAMRQAGGFGFAAEYGGDTLWPIPFYALFALIRPATRTGTLLAVVAAITLGIELLQLVQTPAFQHARQLPALGFLLGDQFLLSDLVCILVGIGLCFAIDRFMWPHPETRE